MTGQLDTIPRTTLPMEERGLTEGSYFEVTFRDGTKVSERDVNWSSIAERRVIGYLGGKKGIMVCKFPVKRIEAFHEGMSAAIDVPEGCEAFQAIRSESIVIPGYSRQDRVVGRIIGIVRDGEVVEERFLNALEYRVQGIRV